jgi:hypothetical protein
MRRLGLAAIVTIALGAAVTTRDALADEDAGSPEPDAAVLDGDAAQPEADAGVLDASAAVTSSRPTLAREEPSEEEAPPALLQPAKPRRDPGELVLLYLVGIQWGGTLSFFIDAASRSNNPYAAVSPVAYLGALATAGLGVALPPIVDAVYGHRPGAAQTVTTSMLIGLAEGAAWNEYFSNRATTSFHTYTKDMYWIYGGETVGLVTGLTVAAFVHTTHGGAAWVETTGLFGGLFAASIAAAATPATTPNDEQRRNAGITGALAGIAGTATGILTVNALHPSALRVHLIDLGWLGGAMVAGLGCLSGCKPQGTYAAMAIGSGLGFVGTFIATSWLPKDFGKGKPLPIHPYAMPASNGGFEVGFGGSL